jgi:glycerol-3-phosphate dehydrogenase (NAD+)
MLNIIVFLQTIEDLEQEMLNGQKLQGPPTAAEVFAVLKAEGTEEK